MNRAPFKLRRVVDTIRSPRVYRDADGSPVISRFVERYDYLECGHWTRERELSSIADAVAFAFAEMTGARSRRCFQCTTSTKPSTNR
jgi:hypothetical protein